jgi:DNA mismatch repair protein MutS
MSSFVVEMTEFRSILRSAGPRTLVIGDELCAGTETASATAIVAAGIQTLVDRRCNFFFATHLHELAEIPAVRDNRAVASYHLTVHPDLVNGSLIYDRTLRIGCGSPMYGLEVCRGLDMDAEFLRSAFNFRKQLFDAHGARLSKYNAEVVVSACQICGGRKQLETHHIVPQASADAEGRIAPGKHKNTKENLVVLCESCHDKHHRGMLEIQGWVQSTHGNTLLVSDKGI